MEHVFVGDLLRRLWQMNVADVEVLRAEFDAGGYDLVLTRRQLVRHVQFKSVLVGGKTNAAKLSLRLMEKPSGCAVWFVVTPSLEFVSFLWFGADPGEPLPNISNMKTARHTKGDRKGTKAERPGMRIVPRSRFERLGTLDEVITKLFGPVGETA